MDGPVNNQHGTSPNRIDAKLLEEKEGSVLTCTVSSEQLTNRNNKVCSLYTCIVEDTTQTEEDDDFRPALLPFVFFQFDAFRFLENTRLLVNARIN